jgi:hypothetical protein
VVFRSAGADVDEMSQSAEVSQCDERECSGGQRQRERDLVVRG